MKDSHIYDFRLDVDIPERVDKLLSLYLPEYSRSTIQKWINNKDILINGKPCSQNDKISESCDVSINVKTKPSINLIIPRRRFSPTYLTLFVQKFPSLFLTTSLVKRIRLR